MSFCLHNFRKFLIGEYQTEMANKNISGMLKKKRATQKLIHVKIELKNGNLKKK